MSLFCSSDTRQKKVSVSRFSSHCGFGHGCGPAWESQLGTKGERSAWCPGRSAARRAVSLHQTSVGFRFIARDDAPETVSGRLWRRASISRSSPQGQTSSAVLWQTLEFLKMSRLLQDRVSVTNTPQDVLIMKFITQIGLLKILVKIMKIET